jgi:membrane protein implicated in regulation of membrane protease activity
MEWAWAWLIGGLALAGAEILVPGVFLIWIGTAALVTGGLSLAFGLPLVGQLALFAGSAIASMLTGSYFNARAPIISDDPLLNERTARLIGRTVTVVTPIAHGEGRVRVGDSEWIAIGTDVAVGEKVTIVGANGGRLVVEPVSHTTVPPLLSVRPE